MDELADVTCPSCFEVFSVLVPAPGERPCELDYDCEVCCRPMVLEVFNDGGMTAKSWDE